MSVTKEPSAALRRLAARVNFSVRTLNRARGSAGLDTQWEALWHAWALTSLVARHSGAVVALAKTDVVLLPSAWAVARASMESAARAVWLLAPEDVWEREARWLALQEEAARLHDRAALWSPAGAARSKKAADDRRAFVRAVSAKLPDGVHIPGIPSVGDMLRPYGEDLEYFYGLASQYVHAADYALGHYRHVTEEGRLYGESVNEGLWVPALRIAWNAFRACTLTLMAVAGEPLSVPLAELDQRVHEAAEAVLSEAVE